ncbi:uba ts-n domain containing protein [Ophiostoma piceae UAMH 11346]|uniref:Uba ts-n domain containing protein n=1 Tax=Ophiostoma piceae (strain UAMH 11346) TaxID=1262450 RepID=S3C7Q7_OPHP1|nr:uba ts-n domain containing protein [Ophiostoma piceae UAMH 11346]
MPITISKSSSAKAAWHKQLHTSNLGAQFEAGRLTIFPRSQLELTKEYLTRKKIRSKPDEADKLLHELINEHISERGSPEVATLACLLEFSPFAAVPALTNFRGDNHPGFSISTYLRLLIVAHSIQPRYVSEHEAQVATALLHIRMNQPEPLLIFRNMVSTLAQIRSSNVLPVHYINKLLIYCKIPESYQLFFAKLTSRSQFASLYRAMSWIKNIIANPEQYKLAYEVIQVQVPEMLLWATWRPDESMLQKWEEYNFKPEHVVQLQPIFRLEGPDSTGAGYPTFKEAGPACFHTINLEPPNLVGIKCLYVLLLQAMKGGNGAIDVMCRLCLSAPATPQSLELAGKIIELHDDGCYNASKLIVKELTPTATPIAQILTLTSVLPFLQQYPAMREIFAGRVIDIVVPLMQSTQETYRNNIKRSSRDNMGSVIMGYGRAVKNATWLNDLIAWPEDFLSKLDRMPSEKVFRDVIQHLERPHSDRVDVVLKDYLAATIGGTGTIEEIASLRLALDAEQEFFLSHFEVERDRILGAIKRLNYVTDIDFLRACRNQILKEDLVLLKDLLPLVERGTCVSCIDMLRILSRRIELPMRVSEVWTSLTLLIMGSHNTTLLDWACDNLPVNSWFRFIADILIVFRVQPEQLGALANVGMTVERFEWWKRLQTDYYRGVEELDRRLRQKNGGIGSMRWLYLQEIPNVHELLDVTVGRKELGYDRQWLLEFFEPSRESLTTLCNCIAAHNTSSPRALYGIRTVLERYFTESLWPDSASQAYLLAWTQSKEMSDEDKKAFHLLSELMSIKPSMNPHGLGFIKNKMLKEYDNVIELARNVEAIRIQLSRKDKDGTIELAQSLGMQGMRSYVDPEIPESLADAIECVGHREYELCFPLSHIKGHDRKVRGIGSDLFPILTVRVTFDGEEKQHGFCVHLSPHETMHDPVKGLHLVQSSSSVSAAAHQYWRPRVRGKPRSRMCTVSFNLFTYTLSQRLHRHFVDDDGVGKETVTLKSIHDIVSDTIGRPGSECTSCGDSLTGLWKPTVCSKPSCSIELSESSLLVQAYGLLVDGPVLDFLLGCVYSAARDSSGLQLLGSDCPYDKAKMCTVLDTFPALPADDNTTPFDLLNKIRTASSILVREREQVLAWMSKWFRGCMLSAPPGKRLSIMSDVEQFLLYNSTPECEKAFYDTVQASGSRSVAKTGNVVFHGSPPARMWKVLTEGLRNMSNTRYMAHGAVNGPGIYLADEPVTSFNYSGQFNNTWSKSAYRGKKVLMGCELLEQNPNAPLPAGAKKPPAGTHIVTDESRVLVRYVFICPSTYAMPVARNIDMAMRSTFGSLRAGPSV